MSMVKTLYDIYMLGERNAVTVRLSIDYSIPHITIAVMRKNAAPTAKGRMTQLTCDDAVKALRDFTVLYQAVEKAIEKYKALEG